MSTVGSCKWTPTAYFLRSRRRMCIKKWPLGATYMTPPTSLRTTRYTAQRAKRMRKTKDECTGRPIAEYVGLRPKMYSIHEADGINIKKLKGVTKCVVKKHIRHEQYKDALLKKKTFHHGMDVLQSEGH